MPDIAATGWVIIVFGIVRALDLPQNPLRRCDLIRTQDQQGIIAIKDAVFDQDIDQSVLIKKGRCKIL